MGGSSMVRRIRTALVAAISAAASLALVAPSAQAGLLSILPGSCGNQPASQPFAQFGDSSYYTPVPGGSFESGAPSWILTGGAQVVAGNESYNVGGAGSRSLSLPTGSSATSLASCTSIYEPTARFFVRNTGSSSSRLTVQAITPGLLWGTMTTTLGQVTGSSSWKPSPAMSLLVSNLLATLSLNQTAIAFRFVPADSTGAWSIDDVYLDPYKRG
jgi:hypothetical protein